MKDNPMDWLAGIGHGSLTFDRPDEVPLEKVLDLRQRDETWQCTARRARIWITPPDRDPYRPHIILTASRDGRVLGLEILEDEPTVPEFINALAKAMYYPAPGSGARRRPTLIHLDDAALTKVLAPELERVGIRCTFRHSLPQAERALEALGRSFGDEGTIRGLLETPGVTPFLVEGLFEAAAFFYGQAPWHWIDDSSPVEIRYPVDSQARYAVVMGHGGEAYGLAIYNSTDVLRETYAGTPPHQLIGREAWTTLLFGEAIETPFADLDATEAYGWPVAAKDAYPLPVQMGLSGRPARPGKSDLLRMEAALLAIPRFLEEHMLAGGRRLRPAEKTLEITVASGEDRIHLRYPVPGLVSVFENERAALTEVVAVRDRNTELLDTFDQWLHSQSLSAATIQRHMDNIGRFAESYLAAEGGSLGIPCPADDATAEDIDDFLGDWLTCEADQALVPAIKSNIASLEKFYGCLREAGEMPAEDSDEILGLLRDDREYYVELAQQLEEGQPEDSRA